MAIERCSITFENFWGEELEKILILTEEKGMNPPTKEMYLYNIKDKQVIINATSFYYRTQGPNYWVVYFTTASGQKWRSNYDFRCNIKPEDNHQITLGINGDSQRLYAAFPSSSSCSTEIFKE
ncbi:TPA: hypothetical protein ACS72K_004108 [Providencia alcalifaciens]